MPRFLAILLFLLIPSAIASACISGGPALTLQTHIIEALTLDSPVILTATIRAVTQDGPTLILDIDSVNILKNHPTPVSPPSKLSLHSPAAPPPAPGDSILCFLEIYDPAPYTPFVYDLVNLDPSRAARSARSPIIRDLALNRITDPQKILDAVRAQLRRMPPTASNVYFDVYPAPLQAFPNDDRLLPAARLWARSSDPHARLLAAQVFAKFPDPTDTPALYSLLNDPFTIDYPYLISPWSAHEFAVRQIAAKALRNMGLAVPSTVLSLPRNDLYHPISLLPFASLLLLPSIGYYILRRLRRKRLCLPRPSPFQSAFAHTTLVSLCFAFLIALLWHRSVHTVDNVVFASHRQMLDLVSYGGYLTFEASKKWPADSPLVHLSFNPSSMQSLPVDGQTSLRQTIYSQPFHLFYSNREPWFAAAALYYGVLGYPFSTRTGGPTRYPGVIATIYYGWLLVLFLLLPAVRLLIPPIARLRRHRRARRAAKLNICPTCSYDLRAHTPGHNCPECGTPIQPPTPSHQTT